MVAMAQGFEVDAMSNEFGGGILYPKTEGFDSAFPAKLILVWLLVWGMKFSEFQFEFCI